MRKTTLLNFALFTSIAIQAQETEIILTQFADQVLVNGAVSCYGGDNAWYREYVLSQEGVATDVQVIGLQFGVEFVVFNEDLKIYA